MTLSTKNFENIVFDPKVYVVVRFYDPSHDDAKKSSRIYEKTSKKFFHINEIVLAEIDITSNDFPFKVDHIPSIYIFFTNEKNRDGVLFKETLTVSALNNFIWSNVFGHYDKEKKPNI